MNNKKKSSSSVAVAPGLKLAGDGNLQGSDLNCLELRLGISSSDNGCGSPWQEKASLDECDLQRESRPEQPVGWPPVRAFRKNQLSSTTTTTKAAAEEPPAMMSNNGSMFVKVNMEGCAVGRKVDLHAHRGYASLSRALQAMFSSQLAFLLLLPLSPSSHDEDDEDDDEQQPQELETNKTYILLYEDNEGDRMLVGDVPWELFVASVKRLYIARDPRARATS